MIRIENHCRSCATDSYPCRGSACPLTHVEVHYCDKCDDELDEIYEVDDMELCEYCLKEMFKKENK